MLSLYNQTYHLDYDELFFIEFFITFNDTYGTLVKLFFDWAFYF